MIELLIHKDIPVYFHEIIKTVEDELNHSTENEIPDINGIYSKVMIYKLEVPYHTPQEIEIKKDILCSALKKALLTCMKLSDFKRNCHDISVHLEKDCTLTLSVGFYSDDEIIQLFEEQQEEQQSEIQPESVQQPKQLGKLYKKVMGIADALAEHLKYKANSGKGYGYQYTELEDFCTTLYQYSASNGLGIKIEILRNEARLTLIDCDTGATDVIRHPFHFINWPAVKQGEKERNLNQQIQSEGAIITYFRRYLLINIFGIALPDTVEKAVKEEALRKFNEISKTQEYKEFKSETDKIKQEIVR